MLRISWNLAWLMAICGAMSVNAADYSSALEYFVEGVLTHDNGDYSKATSLFSKACDMGYARGCHNLGNSYANGQGVRQDYSKAVSLYETACDMGEAKGCYNLGGLYFKGQGVRQNLSRVKKLFGKACDLGEQLGCNNYKILNERGIR